MYGLLKHDIEGMALSSATNHEIYGVPNTSILPSIIKMSATNQEVLANLDNRKKTELVNSFNKAFSTRDRRFVDALSEMRT